MAEWLMGIAAVLILCFGFVVAFGAPYLPTLNRQVETALELADLKKGQTLLELGCGDGKVLLAAARRGYQAVGYELNPLLVFIAWIRTRRYRKQVRVVWRNFFGATWPECEAIFVFGLPRIMPKLDKKVAQLDGKPVKLVSFAFTIPGRQPARQKDNVYLYEYGAD